MKSRRLPLFWIPALILPILTVLGVPALIAWSTGEIYRLDEVIRRQTDGSETLFGSAYSSPDISLKLNRALRDKPDVLVFGSSRTLDIRREFIKPQFTFYNAGRIASDIWVIRQALMKLERPPTHLIVALDQFRFNSAGSDFQTGHITPHVIAEKFAPKEEGWNRFGAIWPEINKDLLAGKISRAPAGKTHDTIGLAARTLGNGFRNDGSYRQGSVIDVPPSLRSVDARLADTFKRIERSRESFEHGDTINPHAVDEVAALLDWCARHQVKIIAYLPAYAPSVIAAMRGAGDHYTYLDQIVPALEPVFTARGLRLFDFTSPAGAGDDEFIDGFHSSERVGAKILLEIAANDPNAAEIIDSPRIEALLKASTDPLVLVP